MLDNIIATCKATILTSDEVGLVWEQWYNKSTREIIIDDIIDNIVWSQQEIIINGDTYTSQNGFSLRQLMKIALIDESKHVLVTQKLRKWFLGYEQCGPNSFKSKWTKKL